MHPDVTPWLRHQGPGPSCGTLCQATGPADPVRGYGPRRTGGVGARVGIVGASRSAGQDRGASGVGIPLSQGAIPKLVARVSDASVPPYTAIGEGARVARVNSMAV